jgi:MFS family permease
VRVRPGAGALIGFRAVQGIGAAMLMPQTLAIVTMTFPPEQRGAAFGVWGAWWKASATTGDPWMAGAASGMLNTVRQVGSVSAPPPSAPCCRTGWRPRWPAGPW